MSMVEQRLSLELFTEWNEVRLSMDNKKFVITGASRGIGLEMARILIEKGT